MHTVKKIEINSKSLELLKKMKHPRNISPTHVNGLYRSLVETGVGFDQPFVVNKRGDSLTLIDGNHRFKAYEKWITEDPDRKATNDFYIYENLSPLEEVAMFSKWNTGRRQSSNDFVELHQDWIPFLKLAEALPVRLSIYAVGQDVKAVSLAGLVKAYFLATNIGEDGRLIFYGGSPQKFVEDLQRLGQEDVVKLRKFINFFQPIFGNMQGDNRYQSTSSLNVLATLYFRNVPTNISEERLASLLKRKIFGDSNWLLLSASGGRSASKTLYALTLDLLSGTAAGQALV